MADLGCKHGHFNCTQCYEDKRLARALARATKAEARAERYRSALVSLDESGHLTPVVRAIVDAALTEPE